MKTTTKIILALIVLSYMVWGFCIGHDTKAETITFNTAARQTLNLHDLKGIQFVAPPNEGPEDYSLDNVLLIVDDKRTDILVDYPRELFQTKMQNGQLTLSPSPSFATAHAQGNYELTDATTKNAATSDTIETSTDEQNIVIRLYMPTAQALKLLQSPNALRALSMVGVQHLVTKSLTLQQNTDVTLMQCRIGDAKINVGVNKFELQGTRINNMVIKMLNDTENNSQTFYADDDHSFVDNLLIQGSCNSSFTYSRYGHIMIESTGNTPSSVTLDGLKGRVKLK
ncbi:hypothetical protein [Prevotella sp. HJM029]|uniref:hypothetical protein n=1 Tax=Prevotella sp. HJM029 TaxID=1433844 RepID=UPI00049005CF|nr:hypothetical protein [Prevotella sp. HJM029]